MDFGGIGAMQLNFETTRRDEMSVAFSTKISKLVRLKISCEMTIIIDVCTRQGKRKGGSKAGISARTPQSNVRLNRVWKNLTGLHTGRRNELFAKL